MLLPLALHPLFHRILSQNTSYYWRCLPCCSRLEGLEVISSIIHTPDEGMSLWQAEYYEEGKEQEDLRVSVHATLMLRQIVPRLMFAALALTSLLTSTIHWTLLAPVTT